VSAIYVLVINHCAEPHPDYTYWRPVTVRKFLDKVKYDMAVAEIELGIARWDLGKVLSVTTSTEEVID
jgi:hypothetical protein